MGNAVDVKVMHALYQLLEQTHAVLLTFIAFEVALLHQAEEITFGTVFHNVVPSPMISTKAKGFDNIWVVQTLCDAEF